MEKFEFLPTIVILIATAVFVVLIFKKLRLSPVLGYFVAGALIGDHGAKIVTASYTSAIAEFGIVFLLFAIGLELSFERLKAMRKYVFGLGSLQILITTAVIAGFLMLYGDNLGMSIVIGAGLALSSTAIVLQVIEESRNQSTQVGRISLAVLLQQDFTVVPLLVIVPMLSNNAVSDETITHAVGIALVKAILALALIFVTGQLFLRPLFKMISSDKPGSANELFIATTLLIVLSAAWGTEHLGLSLALGAFVAGVLVAETEFRRQAEESIYPFKGLLLGLFFMSVGMTIDVKGIYSHLTTVLLCSVGLVAVKALIITGLSILFGFNKGVSMHAGLLLSQGSEFAFILFNLAMKDGILDVSTGKILLLVVTCTMALTPLLAMLGEKLAERFGDGREYSKPLKVIEIGAMDLTNHVILGGFGKVGKMVSLVLGAENVNYIAIDASEQIYKEESENGFPIFKGDISQLETLKAAGADRALAIILSLNNEITLRKALKVICKHFPQVPVIVKSRDLKLSNELYEAGATIIVPSDYETGLQLGSEVLKVIGIGEYEISRIKNQFRAGNYVISQKLDEISEAGEA